MTCKCCGGCGWDGSDCVSSEIILLEAERQLDQVRLERAMYKTSLEDLLFVVNQLSLDTKERFVEGVTSIAVDIENYLKRYLNT